MLKGSAWDYANPCNEIRSLNFAWTQIKTSWNEGRCVDAVIQGIAVTAIALFTTVFGLLVGTSFLFRKGVEKYYKLNLVEDFNKSVIADFFIKIPKVVDFEVNTNPLKIEGSYLFKFKITHSDLEDLNMSEIDIKVVGKSYEFVLCYSIKEKSVHTKTWKNEIKKCVSELPPEVMQILEKAASQSVKK